MYIARLKAQSDSRRDSCRAVCGTMEFWSAGSNLYYSSTAVVATSPSPYTNNEADTYPLVSALETRSLSRTLVVSTCTEAAFTVAGHALANINAWFQLEVGHGLGQVELELAWRDRE